MNVIKKHPLLSYFLITFTITWGIALLVFLFPVFIVSLFGEINMYNPLYFIAVYSPTIATLIVIGVKFRFKGIAALLKRFLPEKKDLKFIPIYLVLLSVIFIAIRFLAPLWGSEKPMLNYEGLSFIPMALLFLLTDAGPIGEEIGRCGLALPLLQKRMKPLAASIFHGSIWAVWHFPQFLISGLGKDNGVFIWEFLTFLIVMISLRVLIAVSLNIGKGAIIFPIMIHWLNNLADGNYLNIIGGDNINAVILSVLYLTAALILWLICKPKTFVKPIPLWE